MLRLCKFSSESLGLEIIYLKILVENAASESN